MGDQDAAAAQYRRHQQTQLARISTGGFVYIHDRTDEQAQLCRRIGAALVKAGFTLYDRVAESPLGGAMIMPVEGGAGVYVGWAVSDALADDPNREALREHVQSVMNDAVAQVLTAYGFDVGEHAHEYLITLGPDPTRALPEDTGHAGDETGDVVDEFTADIIERCALVRGARGGEINPAWSTGERLAVALVLKDRQHLHDMGYTPTEAAVDVQGWMSNPPTDMAAWLDRIRRRLGLSAGTGSTPGTIPIDSELHLSQPGTPEATWVLQTDHDGIGPIADGRWPASGTVPDSMLRAQVAECLEVTGVVLVASGMPHVWNVEITD